MNRDCEAFLCVFGGAALVLLVAALVMTGGAW